MAILNGLDRPIVLDAAADLESDLALGMGVVEMGDGFRDRQKAVNVVFELIRKKALCDRVCRFSVAAK